MAKLLKFLWYVRLQLAQFYTTNHGELINSRVVVQGVRILYEWWSVREDRELILFYSADRSFGKRGMEGVEAAMEPESQGIFLTWEDFQQFCAEGLQHPVFDRSKILRGASYLLPPPPGITGEPEEIPEGGPMWRQVWYGTR